MKQAGELRSDDESPQAVEEESGEDVQDDQEENEDEQPMRPRYSVRTSCNFSVSVSDESSMGCCYVRFTPTVKPERI